MPHALSSLLKNKFFLTAAIITGVVLLLVLLLSPKRSVSPTPSPSATSQLRSELQNLSVEKKQQAVSYVNLISDRLPFYLEGYKTSVGIDTTINIYRFEDDPPEIVRLEIYGLSYINKNELDETKNPNVTAFKESFNKALSLLKGAGIDPKQLIFVYGDKDYVNASSHEWVDKLNLLP